MPQTALSELARSNPRYLSVAERRLLQGLYPELNAPNLPRLRTLPELSDDEHAQARALARAGASVNALVRGFCLTRWTALSIHREGRPALEPALVQPEGNPAPEPAQPEPAQPEPAPQPEPPGTRARESAPEPAESTAEIVARITSRALAAAPREHAPRPAPGASESEPVDLLRQMQRRVDRGRW